MGAVDIPVPHGRLEALLARADAPKGAVVVCHPHPRYGGSMHTTVAYRLANAFSKAGFTALRFNFRGVGLSTGAYDEGRGEVEDALAALDFLQQEAPGVPLWVAGFSFGAWVALELARREARVGRALAVGMPIELMPFAFVAELATPTAFLHADRDEFGRLQDVRALVARAPAPKALFVLTESDHLCTGRLSELSALTGEAISWLLQSGA